MKQIKKGIIIALSVLGLLLISVQVFANGNKWVLDEAQVVSEETENYIQNLNEEVFSTYQNKPQLGIIVINNLPDGRSMDEYKLEQFNRYGVGTKEENCGMLFVLATNDHKYGFEIGDGFKKGSFLRRDLEKDFITADMKSLLREENYDEVVLQIVKHLEQIMANQENGVYLQKEKNYLIEKEKLQAQEKKLFKTLAYVGVFLFLILGIGIGTAIYFRMKTIKKLLLKHQKQVAYLKEPDNILIKYFMGVSNTIYCSEAGKEDAFKKILYEYYMDKECELLKEKTLKHPFSEYKSHLETANNYESFYNLRIKDLDTIIYETDREMEKLLKIRETNYENVHKFMDANKSRISNPNISVESVEVRMKADCISGHLMTNEDLEAAFKENLKELNFRYEYDKFIEENKNLINSEYFDSSEFYNSLKDTPWYDDYEYRSYYNHAWMQSFLFQHMMLKQEAERQQEARRRRQEQARMNSDSTFGSGFGGGHSSGGGFSGGW